MPMWPPPSAAEYLGIPSIFAEVESAGLEAPARDLADEVVGGAEPLAELAHERREECQARLGIVFHHGRERVAVEREQLGVRLRLHAGGALQTAEEVHLAEE